MESFLENVELTEADLLAQCLGGDREAYGVLVARYQALVCAITFSACGRVAASEDLAQEVFVIAWRQLATLRERAQFKAWLCGIARNVARNFVRRELRRGAEVSLDEAAEVPAQGPVPDEAAARREEEALVWQAIAEIPETYREPLVLYYREQQSMEAVAAALDLSEEAVRQRLSRGRSLVKDQLAAVVERTLSGNGPKRALGLGVLAAIAQPASASAAAVTSGGLAKVAAAGKIGTLLCWPILQVGMLLAGFKQRRQEMRDARSERERGFLLERDNVYYPLVVLVILAVGLLMGFLPKSVPHQGSIVSFAMYPVIIIYVIWAQRRLRRIQLEDGTRTEPDGTWNPVLDRDGKVSSWNLYYRVMFPIAMRSLLFCYFADRAGDQWLAFGMLAVGIVAGLWSARYCQRAPQEIGRVFKISSVFFSLVTLALFNWRWADWLASGAIGAEWTATRMNLIFVAWFFSGQIMWAVMTFLTGMRKAKAGMGPV